MAPFRPFAKLLSWIAFLTFDLIVLGSLVRATDSGLACPDWPLCYGKAIPIFDLQIFLEWVHRLVALGLGIVLVIAVIKLARSAELRRAFGAQIIAAGVLFVSQVILGGLTVLKLLDPKTVSAHLLNALAFFSVVVWMAVRAKDASRDEGSSPRAVPPAVRNLTIGLTALTFLQVVLGGAVSTNHAGLACPDFPTCHGSWLPQSVGLVWLQMSHRYTAFALLIGAILLRMMAARLSLTNRAKAGIKTAPNLIVLQILLGMINIFFALPTWAVVLHLANAVLLYTLLLVASLELARGAAFESLADGTRSPKPEESVAHTLARAVRESTP